METYIIILTIFLILLVRLYLTSESDFFTQDHKTLEVLKGDMVQQLRRYGREETFIQKAIKAYDYFTMDTKAYDGATIVRDLFDIKNGDSILSVSSMIHDYEYIMGANRSFKKNFKSNVDYIDNLLKNGKGLHIERFIGLTLISIFFVPFNYIKHKIQSFKK